jgi:O-antigen ligase
LSAPALGAAAAPTPDATRGAVARRGLLPVVGRGLLLLSVPLSVVWIPVAYAPGLGNVTLSDVVLMSLWAAVAAELTVRGAAGVGRSPLVLLVAAASIGVLAGLGAVIGDFDKTWAIEAAFNMKRFGIPAILPLAAALFRARGLSRATRVLSLLAMAAMVLFVARPELQAHLPRPATWNPAEMDDRPTGLLTNANDLAYASVGLAVLHAAFFPRRAGLLARAALAATLAGAGYCVLSSGSRSGLIGSLLAVAFVILVSRIGWRTKALLVAVSVAAVMGGLSASAVFRDRIERFYRERLADENVSSRLEAQWIAVQASMERPLGVGYQNFLAATSNIRESYAFTTSDSVYTDTLLGAGYLGLAALLATFGLAWHLATGRGGDGKRIRQAGLVAFLFFGTASVIPISIFVAPLFFWIPAAGVLAADDR